MDGGGFFRGTSQDQDGRFPNKEKKLIKTMKFPEEYNIKVDMKKVNLEVLKPWIAQKVSELLGFEDEVLIGYIYGLLEEKQNPDPKSLQINITGFLEKDASAFVLDLWKLLISAQQNIGGIPKEFLEKKKEEIKARKTEQERIRSELSRRTEGKKDYYEKNSNYEEKKKDYNYEKKKKDYDYEKKRKDYDYERKKKDYDYEKKKKDYNYERKKDDKYKEKKRYRRDSYSSSSDSEKSSSRESSVEKKYHKKKEKNKDDHKSSKKQSSHHDYNEKKDSNGKNTEIYNVTTTTNINSNIANDINQNNNNNPNNNKKDDKMILEEQLREKALKSIQKSKDEKKNE